MFHQQNFENTIKNEIMSTKRHFLKEKRYMAEYFGAPKQGLESAYRLNINEVIICAGKNGVTPVYDPTGKIYGKGPQYGCLLSNNNLKYKFILLDKHDPDVVTREIQGKPFNARFIEDVPPFCKFICTTIILGIVILRSKRAHIEEMLTVSRVTRNSYAFRTFSETPSISFQNEICEIKCKQKLKKKEMYKVKVYTPKNELYAIDNSSGTEV
ncbi:extracellular matrix protein FRAS1 [Caerostris extrusa]|uniref:Extracellular matrix protein FRAS1 n=1 Tax=Caerostris extrusa TaxID=172846 RepID=A0AAV4Y632_CAEEX|nr:extracellular matrix protein FRAS1 [Caerostris extrusa]